MFELPVIKSPIRAVESEGPIRSDISSSATSLCETCGECCRHVGTPPFLPGDMDFDELPVDLRSSVLASRQRPRGDRECDWFDSQTNRCRHYEHRPILCREFGVDSKACRATRQIARGLHGGGTGSVVGVVGAAAYLVGQRHLL